MLSSEVLPLILNFQNVSFFTLSWLRSYMLNGYNLRINKIVEELNFGYCKMWIWQFIVFSWWKHSLQVTRYSTKSWPGLILTGLFKNSLDKWIEFLPKQIQWGVALVLLKYCATQWWYLTLWKHLRECVLVCF